MGRRCIAAIDIGDHLDEGEDPEYANSLAQILADGADVEVHAFPRRSLYDQTYGTAEERRIGAEVLEKKKRYEDDEDRYHAELADYQRRALALGKGPVKENPGKPPPKPPVKPYTKEQEELALHTKSRDKYQFRRMDIGVPLDEHGAVRPVRSGKTPTGLPMGLMKFTPLAWRTK